MGHYPYSDQIPLRFPTILTALVLETIFLGHRMSSTFFYPGGSSLELDSRSNSLVELFGTGKPVAQSNHPPMFGLNYSQLLSRSFDCQFVPSVGDPQTHSPLSFYVENIVFATGLPFSVTVASLIILQRIYTRLPPKAHKRRAEYSAHRLFSGAYILAAKQYIYMEQAFRQPHHPCLPDLPAGAAFSSIYWAEISSYDVAEVEQLQTEILFVLGRNVAVFPITDASTESYIKAKNSLPMFRNLPLRKVPSLRNLSRMTADEHYRYFSYLRGKPRHNNETASPRPIAGWWKRRAKSYP